MNKGFQKGKFWSPPVRVRYRSFQQIADAGIKSACGDEARGWKSIALEAYPRDASPLTVILKYFHRRCQVSAVARNQWTHSWPTTQLVWGIASENSVLVLTIWCAVHRPSLTQRRMIQTSQGRQRTEACFLMAWLSRRWWLWRRRTTIVGNECFANSAGADDFTRHSFWQKWWVGCLTMARSMARTATEHRVKTYNQHWVGWHTAYSLPIRLPNCR